MGLFSALFAARRHHIQAEAARRVIATTPGRHDRFVADTRAKETNSAMAKVGTGKKLSKRERKALHAHVMDNYRRPL